MAKRCPCCDDKLPDDPVMVQDLTVCQNPDCVKTLARDKKLWRVAVAGDVLALSEAERLQLRKLRPVAWRDDTKARLATIRGRR